jgi:LysM repeat protein
MYYSKKESTKNDYYNRESYLVPILKILLIALLIGLLFVGYLFIIDQNRLESEISLKMDRATQVQITEDLSEGINIKDKSMNQEDIALIVQLVLSKMNKNRENRVVDDELYTKELLRQDVDGIVESSHNIDLKELDREQIIKHNIALKDIDHYNKIIINKPKDEKCTNDRLAELSTKLSFIVDDTSDTNSSSYTEDIIKEIAVRSNEMRIIIVQKGDTLSKIAKRAYDNCDAYIKIFKANPEVIKNPNQIFIGQKLRIPI